MCGLTGIFNVDGKSVSVESLYAMTDVISHRGPDGDGYWVNRFIGFGHKRLAVLDLTPAAHQPMESFSKRLVIAYNGEVYNFGALRKKLMRKGYEFYSTGDTEVVVNAFEEYGVNSLSLFNGMYSFAVWDKKDLILYLARDRYGIKPLYYWFNGKTLIFASEIKSILKHPLVSADVDYQALLEYFTFQNIFTERTLFKNIKILPAGHYLSIKLGDPTSFKIVEYWDYSFSDENKKLSLNEYVERLDFLFKRAVKRQIVSDVNVGAYLSGGMDSGAITSVAAQEIKNLSTFTIGFDMSSVSGLELAFDEREKAEHISYLCKTEHYEAVLKAGDMEKVIPDLVWHLEDLRVGQSYPNFYLFRLAGKFVKVALAGTGGDELFAGYPWRYYRAVRCDDFDDYIEKYYVFWQRLIPNRFMPKFFRKSAWNNMKDIWTLDIFKSIMKKNSDVPSTPEEFVNRSLYFEAKTFLQGLFIVEDKLSMAHSVETRVPFMDNDLVDFAMKVPVKYKLRKVREIVKLNENELGNKVQKYFLKTKDGKIILRKMLERYVPKKITTQIKQGFSAPDATWFRGESLKYIKNTLLSKNAKIGEIINKNFIKEIIDEHTHGKVNRRLLLWSLICFEWWLRIFIHKEYSK